MSKYGFNKDEVAEAKTVVIDKNGFHAKSEETTGVEGLKECLLYKIKNGTTSVVFVFNDKCGYGSPKVYLGDPIDDDAFVTEINGFSVNVTNSEDLGLAVMSSSHTIAISPTDYIRAYACNFAANSFPEDWENMKAHLVSFNIITDPDTNEQSVAIHQVHEL